MTKHLFIINGKSTAGKDSFVEHLFSGVLQMDPYATVANISSVQPIKNLLGELGIDVTNKTENLRNLIVDIKKALNKFDRYADRLAIKDVCDVPKNLGSKDALIFLHVRELDSIIFIKETMPFNWKVSTMWVERPNTPTIANDSEGRDYDYDFTISNSGTLDELKAQAIEFAKKFAD